jgi:hypothetical protein
MRVLLVHNRWRSENPSGNNLLVNLEVELLRGAGIEVAVFESAENAASARRRYERECALPASVAALLSADWTAQQR